jgi:hypothetical protein
MIIVANELLTENGLVSRMVAGVEDGGGLKIRAAIEVQKNALQTFWRGLPRARRGSRRPKPVVQ